MTRSDNPCANCSNRDCANSLLAKWWDLCVESNFTLFKQFERTQSGAVGPEPGEEGEGGDLAEQMRGLLDVLAQAQEARVTSQVLENRGRVDELLGRTG